MAEAHSPKSCGGNEQGHRVTLAATIRAPVESVRRSSYRRSPATPIHRIANRRAIADRSRAASLPLNFTCDTRISSKACSSQRPRMTVSSRGRSPKQVPHLMRHKVTEKRRYLELTPARASWRLP